MSEDRYNFGTFARFIKARSEGRETRFKEATADGWRIFYLLGSTAESDIEDLIEAARVRSNISALGVGGPLTSLEPESVDWQEQVMPHVAAHVWVITCEAFDELGIVFWERTSA